jgi:hypothetical protein
MNAGNTIGDGQLEYAHAFPFLVALAVGYSLLTLASVAALVVFRRDTTMSGMVALNPFGPPDVARRFFSANSDAVRISGFLCSVSAMPLAIYTAIAAARLQSAGVRNAEPYMTFGGGLVVWPPPGSCSGCC